MNIKLDQIEDLLGLMESEKSLSVKNLLTSFRDDDITKLQPARGSSLEKSERGIRFLKSPSLNIHIKRCPDKVKVFFKIPQLGGLKSFTKSLSHSEQQVREEVRELVN